MLHFLWMCIIGLVAGALAKLIMPGKDPAESSSRCCSASPVPYWLGFSDEPLGWYQAGQGAGLIMSVVGAILLLLIYRVIKGRSAAS